MEIYKSCIYDIKIIEILKKTDLDIEWKKEICDYISNLKKEVEKQKQNIENLKNWCEDYKENTGLSEREVGICDALEDVLIKIEKIKNE